MRELNLRQLLNVLFNKTLPQKEMKKKRKENRNVLLWVTMNAQTITNGVFVLCRTAITIIERALNAVRVIFLSFVSLFTFREKIVRHLIKRNEIINSEASNFSSRGHNVKWHNWCVAMSKYWKWLQRVSVATRSNSSKEWEHWNGNIGIAKKTIPALHQGLIIWCNLITSYLTTDDIDVRNAAMLVCEHFPFYPAANFLLVWIQRCCDKYIIEKSNAQVYGHRRCQRTRAGQQKIQILSVHLSEFSHSRTQKSSWTDGKANGFGHFSDTFRAVGRTNQSNPYASLSMRRRVCL